MDYYSDNALAIYKRLYFDKLKKETSPKETHKRIADFIGNTIDQQTVFFNLLEEKFFRPNSPCMINAGSKSKNPHDRALSACYVLGLEDSMDSIIEMWGVCAKIYASGAGTGIPITNLREKGAIISTGGEASGPLAYLNVVDCLSHTVRSGGKTRRAANMGVFNFHHPQVIDILDAKLNGEIQTFNLSMCVDDVFMKSVTSEMDTKFYCISPSKGLTDIQLDVKTVWDKAVNNAWINGDPGLLFSDTTNRFNPFPSLGPIHCTNPCGEVPLPPWYVCNIGSININKFVRNNPGFYDPDFKPYFQWDDFRSIVCDSFVFLDNVIDKQKYIDDRFKYNAFSFRPVGLGIMGLADTLIDLGIPYDSAEAMAFFEDICRELTTQCIVESIWLARDTGNKIDIPKEDHTHFRELIEHYTNGDESILHDFDQFGIHNSNWTCIAPTGSISLSADCSYAWEPLMALVWEKPLVETNETLKIIHPRFERDLEKFISEKFKREKGETKRRKKQRSKNDIIADVIAHKGSIQNLDYLPEDMRELYKVAHDIDPMFKIKMQGAGQKYISMAISSTCNLPHNATVEDVDRIFKKAWSFGLKGITIFRDGCRDDQIVHFGKKEEKKTIDKSKELKSRPIKRDGSTVEIKTPHGKFYITVNYAEGRPIEMFFSVGKQGGLVNVVIDALARVCSKGLQAGMDMEWIIDTLEGLKGDNSFWFKIADTEEKSRQAHSIVDALAQVLEYHFINGNDKTKIAVKDVEEVWTCSEDPDLFKRCPECNKKGLRFDLGCRGGTCVLCGYSSCS
jgi:ribonucleoside-diphosphate reductase alpha chain